MKTLQSPAPVAAETVGVSDYAVRLEDHPLVKAGEVHQIVEMFRGGYLGFAKPIGGEWNPKGWRKCDAEGWMPWSGGENPVPGQRVDYRMSNGYVGNGWHADNLRWTNEVPEHRIIAFRLSRPASEQPVEAIGAGREEIARLIAEHFSGGFDAALQDKQEWKDRSGLGYDCEPVDVNGPFKDDFLSAADAILAALSPASPARSPMGGEVEALREATKREEVARIVELAIVRHGIEETALEGTLLDADAILKALATSSPSPAQGGIATWHPLDDNGMAEVRINGKRITTMPSYPGAEEVAQRINAALSQPEPSHD